MFSPAKAITAAALVFGIGGVLLIAQPFDQEGGSVPGVATDEPRSAPVEVTGEIVCGPGVRWATSSERTVVPLIDGEMTVTQRRGDAWRQTATMSDPRLTGTYYTSVDNDVYQVPGESAIDVSTYTRRIETDDGAWQGSDTWVYLTDGSYTAISTVLVGEGAYEGLSVIWEELWEDSPAPSYCTAQVRGFIIDGDPPAVPEPFVGQ
jgi:hypothetical protein